MVDADHVVRLPLKYGIDIVSMPWILVAVQRFEITLSSILLSMWTVVVGYRVRNIVALSY